ncbi:glycoside hydrolase family 88 protein [Marinimicrobium sp. C2-29]|uniref:glycoside hydrolase family 88 protein n=1 Tax=Marinimicrobium sp. C2-29 TaxID=3139825 RepID=UPI00313A1959
MRFLARALSLCTLLLVFGCQHTADTPPREFTPESVKALTKKVADWQIEHFDEQGKYRALPQDPPEWANREQYHDLEWHNGALYAGMNQWRKIADDPKYTEWLKMIGERNDWTLHKRPYHADDHVVGQFYLSLYEDFNNPEMIKPLRKQFDWILDNPKTGTLDWNAENTHAHDRWGWCDALFMAPPVWARLAKVTGEEKYLDFMHQEYLATYDLLWSEEDQLFFRDSSFFDQYEENGEHIYWSRGNGWVFAGLALMIPDLPQDWEHRDFYLALYKKMARKIRSIQREDGTWSMGLLGDPEHYPIKETSGTAFFTFGLAWGINEGVLDRDTYQPVVMSAWEELADAVTEEGLLGHVQPVGAEPGESFPDYTEVYGVGAFLAAGSEVYKLLESQETAKAKETDHTVQTFMYNGGWCWFQDPRAIIHDGQLIVGGVAGNGIGDAAVGVYDLEENTILGRTTLHKHFDHDDHNSPAFFARPDDSLLAVYARHSTENKHYYRFSDTDDHLNWGEEHTIESGEPVTYMNLYHLADEDTLYNFYRGIEWNPTFVTSEDEGKTWGEPVHFIKSEVEGRTRPYPRYASNGQDTVAVSFTDAHPRDHGTSIYYAEFRNGNFYTADGRLIKNLEQDGPLKPSESERVYQGGGGDFRGHELSAHESAWTSSIVLDEQGHPHIGYSLYLSNNDQRYRLASWDGEQWIDREVAHAGSRLYEREASYTGLISLNPEDPSEVVISTDVHPSTGEALGGKHQIFRADIGEQDETSTVQWEQITRDPARHNIRPMFVPGEEHDALVWQRGQYNTYTDYYMDTVGIIE